MVKMKVSEVVSQGRAPQKVPLMWPLYSPYMNQGRTPQKVPPK